MTHSGRAMAASVVIASVFNTRGFGRETTVTRMQPMTANTNRAQADTASEAVIRPFKLYYHEVEKGGHFAAWEQPQLFTAELRAAFRSLR